jgi:putative transposase
MVAAVFRTIFAQPDAATVAGTWEEVRDQLAGRRQGRAAGLHRIPLSALDQDLVDQPAGTGQQRDQAPRPRGRDLPQRRRGDPTGRRGPGRHARRVASGDRRYLSEGSMALLKLNGDTGVIAAIDSGE